MVERLIEIRKIRYWEDYQGARNDEVKWRYWVKFLIYSQEACPAVIEVKIPEGPCLFIDEREHQTRHLTLGTYHLKEGENDVGPMPFTLRSRGDLYVTATFRTYFQHNHNIFHFVNEIIGPTLFLLGEGLPRTKEKEE